MAVSSFSPKRDWKGPDCTALLLVHFKALLQNAWNCASVGSSSRGFAMASCIRQKFAGYFRGTCCSRIPRRVNSIDFSVIVPEASFNYFNSICFSTKMYMYPHLSNPFRPGFRERMMCRFNLVLVKSFTAQGSNLSCCLLDDLSFFSTIGEWFPSPTTGIPL